jgi:hypothetical protein
MASLTLSKTHEVTHSNASAGVYVDTDTTIKFYAPDPQQVHVTVTMRPGLRYWSCPRPEQLRAWVDAAIAGHGVKRAGKRYERTDVPKDRWQFVYDLEASK